MNYLTMAVVIESQGNMIVSAQAEHEGNPLTGSDTKDIAWYYSFNVLMPEGSRTE